jgi:hypothetical protein
MLATTPHFVSHATSLPPILIIVFLFVSIPICSQGNTFHPPALSSDLRRQPRASLSSRWPTSAFYSVAKQEAHALLP